MSPKHHWYHGRSQRKELGGPLTLTASQFKAGLPTKIMFHSLPGNYHLTNISFGAWCPQPCRHDLCQLPASCMPASPPGPPSENGSGGTRVSLFPDLKSPAGWRVATPLKLPIPVPRTRRDPLGDTLCPCQTPARTSWQMSSVLG